jgi:hypothetical protein
VQSAWHAVALCEGGWLKIFHPKFVFIRVDSWLNLRKFSSMSTSMSKRVSARLLVLIVQMGFVALASGQSMNMTGTWNVEVTFGEGIKRALRFDAQAAGKGTFLVLDPTLKAWGPAKPSEAKWTQGEGNSVTFSGPVEFPIGNVGRDAGMLTCKGKFESDNVITGEVDFSPLVGDRPSKQGTFKATRTGPGT